MTGRVSYLHQIIISPQIIGGKLILIGGRLVATKVRANRVSTFDRTMQSYYPSLLSGTYVYLMLLLIWNRI